MSSKDGLLILYEGVCEAHRVTLKLMIIWPENFTLSHVLNYKLPLLTSMQPEHDAEIQGPRCLQEVPYIKLHSLSLLLPTDQAIDTCREFQQISYGVMMAADAYIHKL